MSAIDTASAISSPEQLEGVGEKRLSNFSTKLSQGVSSLKENVADLHGIAVFILSEGKRIENLENANMEEIKAYSPRQRDSFVATGLHRINLRIQMARNLIDKLYILYEELRTEHTSLLAYENALSLFQASGRCPTLAGDYKHKPFAYYTEKATNILNQWAIIQTQLDRSLDQINIRKLESLQQFEKAATLPSEFLVIIDEYVLLSHFMIKKK